MRSGRVAKPSVVGDVDRTTRHRVTAETPHVVGRRFETGSASSNECDVEPSRGQLDRGRPSDPTRCTGDDCDTPRHAEALPTDRDRHAGRAESSITAEKHGREGRKVIRFDAVTTRPMRSQPIATSECEHEHRARPRVEENTMKDDHDGGEWRGLWSVPGGAVHATVAALVLWKMTDPVELVILDVD